MIPQAQAVRNMRAYMRVLLRYVILSTASVTHPDEMFVFCPAMCQPDKNISCCLH